MPTTTEAPARSRRDPVLPARVPEAMRDELRRIADERGVSASAVVREALAAYLDELRDTAA